MIPPDPDPCEQTGSIIECQNQTLREEIPLVGTSQMLVYDTARTPGYEASRRLRIPVTGTDYPTTAKRAVVEVSVAGRKFTKTFDMEPNLVNTFTWDGLDGFGRVLVGQQTAEVRVGYVYDGVYYAPDAFVESFAQYSTGDVSGNRTRREVTLWSTTRHKLGQRVDSGFYPGWSLSGHHFYDPSTHVLHLGDGREIRPSFRTGDPVRTLAGTGTAGMGEDELDASESELTLPRAVAVAADGAYYVADSGNERIRRISPDGRISTMTGSPAPNLIQNDGCEECTLADIPGWEEVVGTDWHARYTYNTPGAYQGNTYFFAGVAPTAELAQNVDVSAYADEIDAGLRPFYFEVFVRSFDTDTSRAIVEYRDVDGAILATYDSGPLAIRTTWSRFSDSRVAPLGTRTIRVRLIAQRNSGSNNDGYFDGVFLGATDSAPLDLAVIRDPSDLAIAPDGALIVADGGLNRVVRYEPDGTMSLVAGTSAWESSGDGGPATDATLRSPAGVTIAPEGDIYVSDTVSHRIRKISTSGIIQTVAGTGTRGSAGVGGPASRAQLSSPMGLAYGPDGTLYVAEWGNHRISAITPDGRLRVVAGTGIAGDPFPGGVATQERLNFPIDVAIDGQGQLFITEQRGHRVTGVTTSGQIFEIMGTGIAGVANGTLPAVASALASPEGVAVDQQGAVIIADTANHVVQYVAPAFPNLSAGQVVIPNGDEIYVFSGQGQHLETRHAYTNHVRARFEYTDDLLTSIVDEHGLRTSIQRNASAQPVAIVGKYGQLTRLDPDSEGNLGFVENPNGESHQMTYQAGSLLGTFQNPRGEISTMTYDELGKVSTDEDEDGAVQSLAMSQIPDGWSVTRTTSANLQTTYSTSYGPDGVSSVISFPDGTQSSRTTDDSGTNTSTSRDGTVTTAQSIAHPRWGLSDPDVAVTTRLPSGLTRSASTSIEVVLSEPGNPLSLESEVTYSTVAGRTTTSAYSIGDGIRTTTTPENRVTTEIMDALGRLTALGTPGAPTVRTIYDGEHVTGILIDPDGIEGNGDERATTMEYDPSTGLLTRVIDPLTHETLFGGYDGADRPQTITLPDLSQVQVSYDPEGNVASVTPPGKAAHGMTYGPRGRIESYTPPVGNSVEFFYDLDRRMDLIDFGLDGAGQPNQVDFEYNPLTGQLSTITSPTGSIQVGFTNGHMTSLASPSIGGGITTSIGYDGFLPTSLSWSGTVSGEVNWTYNDRFLIQSETIGALPETTVTYQYDNDGLVTQAGDLEITRDPTSGRVVQKAIGRIRETFEYNEFAELSRQTVEFMEADLVTVRETLYDVVYDDDGVNGDRDALGRITKKTEWIVSGDVPNADGTPRTLDARTYDYGYNPEGRPWLESVAVDGTVVSSYGYDDNGNRTSAELNWSQLGYDSKFDYSLTEADTVYDSADKLLQYGTKSYEWNNFGQLQSVFDAATNETTTYSYDLFGNLLAVGLPDGRTIEYDVDGAGRRVGRREFDADGLQVSFRGWIYRDLLRPIAEVDESGNVVARYVYADSEGLFLGTMGQLQLRARAGGWGQVSSDEQAPSLVVNSSGVVALNVRDNVGSTRLLVNVTSGEVLGRVERDEFGRSLSSDDVGTLFGFGGGQRDEAHELVRFGARDYTPELGSWTQGDPILWRGGQDNLYLYVNADPINLSDPAGTGPIELVECLFSWKTVENCLEEEADRLCSGPGRLFCDDDDPGGGPFGAGSNSTPGSGNGSTVCGGDDSRCEDQYQNDLASCRAIGRRSKSKGARCYESAMNRLIACQQGRPSPPLHGWN